MQDITLLKQALPYLRKFKESLFVIKFGGEAIRTQEQLEKIAEDIGFLYSVGIKIIIVHGGGAQVTEMEKTMGVTSRMVGGRRVTDEGSLKALKMVLSGSLNLDLVAALRAFGVNAVGISAVSGGLIEAKKRPPTKVSGGGEEVVDFGFVGDIVRVNPTLAQTLLAKDFLPVVSPLSGDSEGNLLNLNADVVACRLASELKAEKLLLMSDQLGVMAKLGDPTTLISQLTAAQAKEAISQGIIKGGMIPKVEEALKALQNGVSQVHILSAVEPHTLLVEVFTESGCGTMLVQ